MPTPEENHELVGCFACGTGNASGLHLRFRFQEGGVVAETVRRPEWLSWRGMIHGGILAAAMDEAMGWAVAADGWTGLTGRISARLLRPVAPGQRLRVRGWVLSYRQRVARTAAEMVTPGGTRVAQAEALTMLTRDLPAVPLLT